MPGETNLSGHTPFITSTGNNQIPPCNRKNNYNTHPLVANIATSRKSLSLYLCKQKHPRKAKTGDTSKQKTKQK